MELVSSGLGLGLGEPPRGLHLCCRVSAFPLCSCLSLLLAPHLSLACSLSILHFTVDLTSGAPGLLDPGRPGC